MKRTILAILGVAALAVGVAGGLLYTWLLDPVEYYDAEPDSLYVQDKFVYLALIGDLYAYEQDLELARARLSALDVEADGPVVADLLEQYLDGGGRLENVRNLAQLARDLGASGGVLLVFGERPGPSPETTSLPEPLFENTAEPGAPPTPVPSATPAPSYQLVEQTALCAEPGQPGKITIWIEDQTGTELPGVEVVVSWATGQDRFFTGLRPEKGAGYTDFVMKSQIEYEVDLANYRGDVIKGLTSDLSAGTCPTQTIAIDWRLIFQVAASDSP